MSDDSRQQIYDTLSQEDTEKLIGFWQHNNRAEWNDQAFEVMAEILHSRLGQLPPQNEPVYDATEEEVEKQEDDEDEKNGGKRRNVKRAAQEADIARKFHQSLS